MNIRDGLNNEIIQQSNRCLVLSIIINEENISRKELSDITGLGRPAITNIVNEMIEAGIVTESGQSRAYAARKTRGLSVADNSSVMISCRITRSFWHIQAFGLKGNVIDSDRCPVNTEDDINVTKRRIRSLTENFLDRFDNNNILGLCMGVPGPYIKKGEHGIALVSGFEKLKEINPISLVDCGRNFPIFTEHDAHLSALAQWCNLPADEKENCRSLIVLQSIGIGIGAGIIIDGRILEGAFGIAGEIGQMGVSLNGRPNSRGARGMFENYASSASVMKYVMERLPDYPNSRLNEENSFADILRAYAQKDPLAIAAYDALAVRLAYGLAGLVYVVNPDQIIIEPEYPMDSRFTGRVNDAMAEVMEPEIRELIHVRSSRIKADTTILGGYHFMLRHFIENRTLYQKLMDARNVR